MAQVTVELFPAGPIDAGEIFTVQRAAFVTEAQVYGDPSIPPLIQTLSDLERELRAGVGLKAMMGQRLVGAIRGRTEGHTFHVGRLAVAPDVQGHGIGTRLLSELENRTALDVARFELAIGSLSLPHLRIFERSGYNEFRRERMHSNLEWVFMEKPSPGAASGL